MRKAVLLLLVLTAAGCADIPGRQNPGRTSEREKALEDEISLLRAEERVLTNVLQKIEYELGPADAEKLRAARDEAYPPAQRIHDLAAAKGILSRRVKALAEQRKLYGRIMSGPY
jgi:hypothetical protein